MRIYKMTATFGKLENQTLTLEPGLNIITAPNEWGKSTWCAFLIAMLYGLDTRAKSTKTALADKERYAPWSGAPMEGRIDLNWQGRDITIQRRTRKRVPLGEFAAFETESGLPVEELNAGNCGQMLLGVEQGVFRRAGFIRFSDLPVTQDEALRRRLNALVTTGDESGAGDRLAESLKDLKNRCRYNRSGLLPQAEKEREEIYSKLDELTALEHQSAKLRERLEEGKAWETALENHKQSLDYTAAQRNAGRLAQAEEAKNQAEAALEALEADCAKLPSREEAEEKIQAIKTFREQWNAIQQEKQAVPELPELTPLPPPFVGMHPDQAKKMARQDAQGYVSAAKAKIPALLMLLGLLGIIGAAWLLFAEIFAPGAIAACAALAAITWSIRERVLLRKLKAQLLHKYGNGNYSHWADPVVEFEEQARAYGAALRAYREQTGDLEQRFQILSKKNEALCGGQDPETVLDFWQEVQAQWDACQAARREAVRTRSHFDTVRELVKPVEAPSQPDELSYSMEDTLRLLSDADAERQRLLGRLGQYQGRMEALGNREAMEAQLERFDRRIGQLEDTYSALSIALETLADARAELQRRFAPKIARRAQELLSAMTAGRYHSLTMGEDFSLQAGAGEEAALREGLWRSDGTVDQLYLSLRLAVAEALTPEAPVVLDDALVRFDDVRMKAALEILREMGKEKQKQIILFTCQGRELEA